ncbi:uncharacterized protein BP5553_02579 [Venustampulla echinocandica]|uniref:Nuclear RNA binding protein n=1 Tax=Venustampulla echinocandica TaxID=2656787 RepID=A0A370TRS8_9HELO|nr:uncharacterized protein BP5553_02579 [Venustampulla echinocandica]RDL38239.1 hypothetical protein BP5553_02579 [Venustampulla echinocandica]
MATRTAHPRDTSRNRSRDTSRTRDRSVEPQQQRRTVDSTPKAAGTKRLFSNRASRLPVDSEDHGENYGGDTYEDEEVHSEKRRRPSDWPLSNTSPASTAQARQPLRSRSRNTPNSPNFRRRSSSQARPSKFVEGSMNDRASMKPPMPYIGTEQQFIDGLDEHRQNENRWSKTRKYTHHANASLVESTADRSEISRHSGIFRFGKSIASSFNPSNWKIWSKPQPAVVVDEEEIAQQRILRERQEAAERIYQELKQAGHFKAATPRANRPQLQEPGQEQQREMESQKNSPAKHDSGVDFYDQSAYPAVDISREEKRKGTVFLEPPSFPSTQHRGESPAASFCGSAPRSTNSSPSKQSFSLKRASFSNIKKAFTNDSVTNLHETEFRQARRIPSRKDLQKQQKLVKRVSDLEGKLEAARRQLTESLAEPVPSQPMPPARIGRPRFVPGALSTLPSERLLSGYVSSEADASEGEAFYDIGRAVTVDQPKKDVGVMPGKRADSEHREPSQLPITGMADWNVKPLPCPPKEEVMQSVEDDEIPEDAIVLAAPSEELVVKVEEPESSDLSSLEEEHEITPKPVATAKKTRNLTPKKRKSVFEGLADDGGRYKPTDADSDGESEIKKPALKKKSATARPRKLQKVTQEAAPPMPRAKPSISTVAARRSSITNTTSSIPTARASSSSRLVKPTARTSRQSTSPPPSSTFTGLDYAKSSTSSKARKNSEQLASPAKNVAYIANPAMGNDVPPMPKLPKAVRLASGEVVSTQGSSVVGEGKRKLRKEKPGVESESEMAKASFEWPADVF